MVGFKIHGWVTIVWWKILKTNEKNHQACRKRLIFPLPAESIGKMWHTGMDTYPIVHLLISQAARIDHRCLHVGLHRHSGESRHSKLMLTGDTPTQVHVTWGELQEKVCPLKRLVLCFKEWNNFYCKQDNEKYIHLLAMLYPIQNQIMLITFLCWPIWLCDFHR